MKNLVAVCVILFSHLSFAQSNLNERIIAESRGTCFIFVNPHSYGCNDWTFKGTTVFPLFDVDWMSRKQGAWAMVTYADPQGNENSGPEFVMLKAKGRHTIPAGVFDVKSGRNVGAVRISGAMMTIDNWQGTRLTTDPNTFNNLDRFTVQMQAVDAQRNTQLFTCRDFERSNTSHLLCRWDTKNRNSNRWQHKGYLGFLRTGN